LFEDALLRKKYIIHIIANALVDSDAIRISINVTIKNKLGLRVRQQLYV